MLNIIKKFKRIASAKGKDPDSIEELRLYVEAKDDTIEKEISFLEDDFYIEIYSADWEGVDNHNPKAPLAVTVEIDPIIGKEILATISDVLKRQGFVFKKEWQVTYGYWENVNLKASQRQKWVLAETIINALENIEVEGLELRENGMNVVIEAKYSDEE